MSNLSNKRNLKLIESYNEQQRGISILYYIIVVHLEDLTT